MLVGADVFVGDGTGVLATWWVGVDVAGFDVGAAVGVLVAGRGVTVGCAVLSGVTVVVGVFDGAGGGLKTGGGGGSPSLGGSTDTNVPIGVGVGANDASVGVGERIVRGVLMTLAVAVGPSGVSITSATSFSESTGVLATVLTARGVLVASTSASVLTTVGAEIVGRAGGRGLSSWLCAGITK